MGYPKEVYANAVNIMESRRENARARAAAHREEIYRGIPEIEDVERRMSSAAARITKAVVTAPERAGELIEDLKKENLALQKRRNELLLSAGYPADYTQERYDCHECRDTGYIGVRMCPCMKALLKAEAHKYLGTYAPSGRYMFSNFKVELYPDVPGGSEGSGVNPRGRMREILSYCRRYAENFSPVSESLLLLGLTGLGKTHMSLAIAQEVTDRGFGVLYACTQQLMDRLENDRFSRAPEAKGHYGSNMDIIFGCDLLILDDLGAEFPTSFTASALYNIVNSRLSQSRPVIVSTNLDPHEIEERYSQRMASRLLCEYKVLKFYGKDVRFLRRLEAGPNARG